MPRSLPRRPGCPTPPRSAWSARRRASRAWPRAAARRRPRRPPAPARARPAAEAPADRASRLEFQASSDVVVLGYFLTAALEGDRQVIRGFELGVDLERLVGAGHL